MKSTYVNMCNLLRILQGKMKPLHEQRLDSSAGYCKAPEERDMDLNFPDGVLDPTCGQ